MRSRLSSDLLDALAWGLVSALVLLWLPIGHVSADGIGQSSTFGAGFAGWNPNHLFVEPLGAWWQGLLDPRSSRGDAVDHLRRLSILAGALAAGLFRHGVARRLASSRFAANHATAWMAGSTAFARLWILDEIYMVQMPAVVLVSILTLRVIERPSLGRAGAVGASVTLAAAFFISNLLAGPALAVACWRRPRHAAGLLLANLLTALALFATLWSLSSTTQSLGDWVSRYGGGGRQPRAEAAYGMTNPVESTVRALYGAACGVVDLMPAVAAVRDGLPVEPVILRLAALIAGSLALLSFFFIGLGDRSDRRNQGALVLLGAWSAAVLAFAIFWNNSDEQFYGPLAVAFGALAARVPFRRSTAVWLALGGAALFWNVIDLGQRRVFYPRQERLALIERELQGAGLVVYPGYDEMQVLLTLNPVAPSLPIARLAVQSPVEQGLDELARTVEESLAQRQPVALVDMIGISPTRNPWKFLRRLGYEQARVEEVLRRFKLEPPRKAGPFTVHWIRARAGRS